jgi:hypothetical protein
MVSIDIYNSAGEKVRSLYNGPSQQDEASLKVNVSGPQAGGAPVLVDIGGLGVPGGDPLWNGSNQGGQWVANGVYYVKVSSTDPFGNTTTVTTPVNVVGVENQELVEVFNSAGEVVRKFNLNSLTSTVQDISLPAGQSIVAASVDPSTGTTSGGAQLSLSLANGGTGSLYWDGLGDGGAPLQSGSYLVELVRTQPGSTTTIKTLSVSLLQPKNSTAESVAASAKVGPNPVLKGGDIVVGYKPSLAVWVRARLYNDSGELIAQAVDMAGSGRLNLGSGFSSGIYLLDFEVCRGEAVVARRVIKAAVVH